MATIRSRQLTPDETIEAVTRVAGHVPVQVVADDLGVPAEVVRAAVARAKASREAREGLRAPQAEATPAVPDGRGPNTVLVVARPVPSPPPQESVQRPAARAKSVDAADLYTIEELCKWADDAGINRAVTLAERVRVAAEELRSMLRRREEIDARKAKVAKAEQLLAAARAELAEITGGKRLVPRSTPSGEVSTSTMRAWAIDHGYDVPPRGLLRHEVIAAYHAAHSGTGTP